MNLLLAITEMEVATKQIERLHTYNSLLIFLVLLCVLIIVLQCRTFMRTAKENQMLLLDLERSQMGWGQAVKQHGQVPQVIDGEDLTTPKQQP